MTNAFEFNNHFLNQIIYHSIQNDEFLKSIRSKVPQSIFKTKDKKFLIKIIYEYYDEYKVAPKENFYDIFKEYQETMSDDLYDRCINLIGIIKDLTGSNHAYILKSIDDAINHFQLEEASVEFALLIKRKKYDEAKSIILKALKSPDTEKPYYNFFEDKTFILNRTQESKYKMFSKINKLDKAIGGFRTGWLITILGSVKSGKTWWLIEFAVTAILQGLNVLFVSLEMGKDPIDERFDMAMGFMTSNENKNKVDIIKKVGDTWINSKEKVDTIYDTTKVLINRNKVKKMNGGNLEIIAFNRGRLNYIDIERILDELEETKGFFTDVLIVDYLGIMKETQPGQSKKEKISENCIGLKEICGKRNLIGFSAMQGNRKAMQSKTFHSYMVADDIDTIFNSDLVLAHCQTPAEEKKNKARIYIANYRHGKQHIQIGIVRDLTIGQVALDSFDIKEKDFSDDTEKMAGVDY